MYSLLTWTRRPTRSQIRTLKNWLARIYANVSVEEVEGPATSVRYLGWIEGPEDFADICYSKDVRAIRKKACDILGL